MIRILKIVLILFVAIWGIVGAWGNVTSAAGGIAQVAQVLSMEGTFNPNSWRAVESTPLVWLAWSVIPIGKLVAGVLCAIGAWQLWGARRATAAQFNGSKTLAVLGCGVAVAMLYGAFMVIANIYFQLWQVETDVTTLPRAFRHMAPIAFIMLFVNMPDTDEGA